MSDPKTLYDTDFFAWSKQQAEAVRAAGRRSSNQSVDWENVAEEIADLGKSERAAIASFVMRIIQHLTKLEYSPALEPRAGWRRTVRLARLQVQRRLEQSPSLRPGLPRIVEEEMQLGIEYAIGDLEEHGEADPVTSNALRRTRYTPDQVLGDWLPPEPDAKG